MKRVLPWVLTVCMALILVFVLAISFSNNLFSNLRTGANNQNTNEILPAKKLVEVTSEVKEIKTNLKAQEYVVMMDFSFQLDTKTTKENFDMIKDDNIRPLIIKTLADMSPEQLNGAKGKDDLCDLLLTLINKNLAEGKVSQIKITNYILTEI